MDWFLGALMIFVLLTILELVYSYRADVLGVKYGRGIKVFCWVVEKCALLFLVGSFLFVMAYPLLNAGSC